MNLPALYAAVCAKRPELAVHALHHCKGRKKEYWVFLGMWIHERPAATMIFDRWFKDLPAGRRLYMNDGDMGGMPGPRRWIVEDHYEGSYWGLHDTPLEALAAYYLGEAT